MTEPASLNRKPIPAGTRFGRYEVIGETIYGLGRARVLCRCACGRECLKPTNELLAGRATGCRQCRQVYISHGQSRTPEYSIWIGLRRRCSNPKDKRYPEYGGRGIAVADEWYSDFASFLRDVGPRPTPLHSIDRIDNNDDYRPGNCRWAVKKVQQRNRRVNRILTFNGRSACLSEWAEVTGIGKVTLHHRLSYGWSIEKALTTPTQKRKPRRLAE